MAPPVPPEVVDRAARRFKLFGVALVATLVVAGLPLPARLTGLGFAGLAIWAGIRLLLDLTAVRRAGQPTAGWLTAAAGLGLAVLMFLRFGLEITVYPLLAEQERCLSGAITHQDRDDCRIQFEQRQEEILRRVRATP
ncbi:MAG: hypothetical protein QG622_1142 [Actinomycetota bacterium]|nr:hypothetical protein [Actinomycetota bacterium]